MQPSSQSRLDHGGHLIQALTDLCFQVMERIAQVGVWAVAGLFLPETFRTHVRRLLNRECVSQPGCCSLQSRPHKAGEHSSAEMAELFGVARSTVLPGHRTGCGMTPRGCG